MLGCLGAWVLACLGWGARKSIMCAHHTYAFAPTPCSTFCRSASGGLPPSSPTPLHLFFTFFTSSFLLHTPPWKRLPSTSASSPRSNCRHLTSLPILPSVSSSAIRLICTSKTSDLTRSPTQFRV
ncbi:hypothetical protein EV356DRAFT_177841 [Viridothelium virens]|uniref:Secreted protein n=1 Tax=Viridothelium virens TaxID=1048519 RepID=A0A6A6H7S7_VIRVR|nr:hypothetical protein EV356DRAFT_177841 [Viridothelium virens]